MGYRAHNIHLPESSSLMDAQSEDRNVADVIDYEGFFEEKPNKAIDYFWIGFGITTVGYTLMTVNLAASQNYVYLQFLGMMIFLTASAFLLKRKLNNIYLIIWLILNFAWSLYIISRGFNFGRDYLIEFIIDAYNGLFLYLSPLIIFFPLNFKSILKVLNVTVILGVLFILLTFLHLNLIISDYSENGQRILENFARFLSIPCGFLLLINTYLSNKKIFLSACVIIITLILATIQARRGLLFISLNILVFAFIIYFFANKGNLIKRFLPLVFLPFLIFFASQKFVSNSDSTFSNISERIDEDTRSGVVEFFFIDMKEEDWIIGRGVDGEYYCPIFYDGESDYRDVIETNYLQIILKGGVVYLVILLLIAIPAMIKGIFYSTNTLAKAAGIWILFWLVNMYPTTVTDFALNYLIVWICIGICYNRSIRLIPEEEMKTYFLQKE